MDSVSVVVVNHNAGAFLSKCVTAALGQAKEVIVVDNASKDSSISDLLSIFPSENRLKVIRQAKNMGFASACNTGFHAASEQYVLFLNPDCVLGEGALKRMVEVLKADPSAGMVGGFLVNLDGSEQGGGRRAVPTPWRSFVRAFGLYRLANRWPRLFFDFYLHRQPLPKTPMEVEAVSGALMLVKREVIRDVGLLDEGYFLHCEDLDWCMRFRQKKYKILFVPDALVYHYLGFCSRSIPWFVEWHKHHGMLRFYHKFFRHQYPGILMWMVTFGVWLRFCAVCVYYGGLKVIERFLGKKY